VFPPLPSADGEGPRDERYRYLEAVFALALGMMVLYFVRYELGYRDTRFRAPLVAQTLLLALGPVLYRVTRSYDAAAWFVGLVASLYVIFHAFIAGGFASPGLFWLMGIPLTLGTLLRRRGLFAGAALVAVTLAWFALVGPWPGYHDFFATPGVFQVEVAFNMTTFVAYGVVTTDVFLTNEGRALAAASRQKGEVDSLLRIVLHDIASPLTVARTEIALLQEDQSVVGPEDEAALARVDAALVQATAIISGVRSVRALKDGKLGLHREVVDLAKAVVEVVALFGGLARDKRVELCVRDVATARVSTDAFVLTTIILPNLLSNALKFTPEGRRVLVDVRARGEHGVVLVKDEGVGIPDALLPRLFAFGKATTRPGARGERGTGYGLPIVREYLGTLDGTIEVRSSVEPGASGTEVEITLPLAS
jgi:signal transduction histidine kinase